MSQSLHNRDILSIKDLSLKDFQLILETAKKFKSSAPQDILRGKLIASCFFEPSTRTRLSFEAAALQLGGKIIGFSSDENLSIKKGESLSDTIRIISAYTDLMIIRHPLEGAARLAADISNKPVINAGDGANQHPTQTLIDFFTIQECQQRLDGLNMALVGDLKYGRTIHSLAEACTLFDIRLYLVSPEGLSLPEVVCDALKKQGVRFSLHESLQEIIPKIDILYMTRIQQERLGKSEYSLAKNNYILTTALLEKAKKNLKVLHPLPRLNEIDSEIDNTPFAYYFQQAANGFFVRQALLALLLSKSIKHKTEEH